MSISWLHLCVHVYLQALMIFVSLQGHDKWTFEGTSYHIFCSGIGQAHQPVHVGHCKQA